MEQYSPLRGSRALSAWPCARVSRMTACVCVTAIVSACVLIALPLLLLPTGFGITQLDQAVTADQVFAHLRELQALVQAPEYQGSRSLRFGFNTSRDYVLQVLQTQTNFDVMQQQFSVDLFEVLGTPKLSVVDDGMRVTTLSLGDDFKVAEYSGSGNLENVPIFLAPDDGCTPPVIGGKMGVLLVARGNCPFLVKAQNAVAQGYIGVMIFNNLEGPPVSGTLTQSVPVPVLLLSRDAGIALSALSSPTCNLTLNTATHTIGTTNICADSPGPTDRIIVAGAHLDSVDAGPGMNDNGSGAASNLVLATHFYRLGLGGTNRVRFCWWASEEQGLKGAGYYVSQATKTGDIKNVVAALNYDMLGSPNYIIGVYNVNETLPNQETRVISSLVMQKLITDYFDLQSQPYVLVPLSGRSDYQPFLDQNIPIAGLETGAEGIKSVAERDIFGGSANVPYDSCYHQACDTVSNVNKDALQSNLRALAHLLQILSSKTDVRAFLLNP